MSRRFLWGAVISIALGIQPSLSLAQYDGGTGTDLDPFLIATPSQMQAIGADPNDWDDFFLLTDDIDLSGFDGAGGNPAYNIIGNDQNQFTGQFDGAGFTILNLTINSSGTSNLGLFGYVGSGGVIENVQLFNPTVTAINGDYAGSLVGFLNDGSVLSCQVKDGTVSGLFAIGGLIGTSTDANVHSCGVTGVVSGTDFVGGLIGQDISQLKSSLIQSSFANTTLTGSGLSAGGLIGLSDNGSIFNCYSKGSVTGNDEVGGLIGQMVSAFNEIAQCYSACSVSGNIEVGGLIGNIETWNEPSITACFWDKNIGDPNFMCGAVETGNCDDSAGRTTAQLQQEETFVDPGDPNNNWDFVGEVANGTDDFWRICEGLDSPKLSWELLPGDWACPDGVGIEDLMVLSELWLMENFSGDIAPNGGDGTVNFLDWGALSGSNPISVTDFSQQWLQTGTPEVDIAPNGGDGVFNLFDFAEMSKYWMMGQ